MLEYNQWSHDDLLQSLSLAMYASFWQHCMLNVTNHNFAVASGASVYLICDLSNQVASYSRQLAIVCAFFSFLADIKLGSVEPPLMHLVCFFKNISKIFCCFSGAVHHQHATGLPAPGMHCQSGQESSSCGSFQHPRSHLQNICTPEQPCR